MRRCARSAGSSPPRRQTRPLLRGKAPASRLVCEIQDKARTILIVAIGERKEVCRWRNNVTISYPHSGTNSRLLSRLREVGLRNSLINYQDSFIVQIRYAEVGCKSRFLRPRLTPPRPRATAYNSPDPMRKALDCLARSCHSTPTVRRHNQQC